jgi:hypothetical protein
MPNVRPVAKKQEDRVAVLSFDPLLKVENSKLLDKRTKRSINSKVKNVAEAIQLIEKSSGFRYPLYYIEPVLTIVPPADNVEAGVGVLYARTIPLEIQGKVMIVVEITAPLVLYATKATLRLVLAHEFLHYVELIRNFSSMNLTSQITSSSIFEERFTDYSRAIDPFFVFKEKKFAKSIAKKTTTGFDDPKLNEKCKEKWMEKGLPVAKIGLGTNQVNVGVDSVLRSDFDPKIKELISKIP